MGRVIGKKTNKKQALRARRQRRVRKKIAGTAGQPRLAVFRSNRHISVQVIDDEQGKTLAFASTTETDVAEDGSTSNIEAAKSVGQLVGQRAKAAGVEKVIFDRGGNRYHGRVAALADGAREAGLEF